MNSRTMAQDAMLLAFVDGQLTSGQRQECLMRIRADGALAVHVFQWRHQKALVRHAFSCALPPAVLFDQRDTITDRPEVAHFGVYAHRAGDLD